MFRAALPLFLLTTLLVLPAEAQPGHHWTHQYGDNGSFQEGVAVASDEVGNTLAAGNFQGTVDFGNGPIANAGFSDIYVMKVSAAGVTDWSHGFGSTGFDVAYSVALDDSGNVYLGGEAGGSIDFGGGLLSGFGAFLAKYDSNGNHLWSQFLGAGTTRSIAYDRSNGRVLVAGNFSGTIDLGGGPLVSAGGFDCFVAGYDASGAHVWSTSGGGTGTDLPTQIAVDALGRVTVGGESNADADFGGGNLPKLGTKDSFVVSYDAGGSYLWSRRFGSASTQTVAASVAAHADGVVQVAVSFLGSVDFGNGPLSSAGSWDVALLQLDATGATIWSRRFGGTSFDQSPRVAVTSSGQTLLLASFRASADFGWIAPLTASGGQDLILAAYDAAGTASWVQTAGGSTASHFATPRDVAVGGGDAAITGNFNGVLDFPPGVAFLDARPCSCTDAFVGSWLVDAGFTPSGSGVTVAPVIDGTGQTPVNLSFDNVSTPGSTTVSVSNNGPVLPANLSVGSGFYDLSTSATFTGSVQLCFDYDPASVAGPAASIQLLHFDSTLPVPDWVDITTSIDSVAHVVCGSTTSLSPFVLATTATATSTPEVGRIAQALLLPNRPNPFNPSTEIRFELARAGRVEVEIVDVRGARVRTLFVGAMDRGLHHLKWNGRDGSDRPVASGVYRSVLRFEGTTQSRSVVLVE